MKAVVNSDGSFSVEVEGGDPRTLFEEIATAQEVFGNLVCSDGKVSSDKIQLRVREDDDANKYYEAVCVDESEPKLRYARKKFGCHKKGGGLFPKGGWVKWDRDQKAELDLVTGEPVGKE